MEKISESDVKSTQINKTQSIWKAFSDAFKGEKDSRITEKQALIYDLILFTLGFVLARCHLVFGARPIGLAFIAMLPVGVWPALFGCVIGALTLGLDGMVIAGAAAIIIFLRAAMSASGDGNMSGKLFHEALLIRICISVLGGFIVALYEILASGLNETTLLFGLTMIITTPLLSFLFSGAFAAPIDVKTLLYGNENILSFSNKNGKEKYDLIFFWISTLSLLFFTSLSLKGVDIFGISLSFVCSSLTTLICAKRFGAMRALSVGFVTSLGISSSLSVSFALLGLASGIMFSFGTGYALIAGGFALGAWSAYTGGLGGLLSTMPEYIIAATVGIPLLKKIGKSEIESYQGQGASTAEDMVGTMALAYQSKYSGSLDMLEMTLASLSAVVRNFASRGSLRLSQEEYRAIVIETANKYCLECSGQALCNRENICPCIKNASSITEKLALGEKISAEDVNTSTEFCQMSEAIAADINSEAEREESEAYRIQNGELLADEYELIAKLINSARTSDEAERRVDDSVTDSLSKIFEGFGFENGTIRAFGERRRHLILAGEDEDGSKITSKELRGEIEDALGIKLATPEYFRKDKMVLMECGIRRMIQAEIATAEACGSENEVSGDSICAFESADDRFFALISDGMGSGEVAKETSMFVTSFMRAALNIGMGKEALIHMLNRTIRAGREECSSTVDLFELDLLTGEATFLKSGAAPSFIKRENSIFRIRSQTAPIGLLGSIDTEKIKVEVKPGDYVIMLSDGIVDSLEDAPWLLVMLGENPPKSLHEYAKKIIDVAKEHTKSSDDMSVAVIKINEF